MATKRICILFKNGARLSAARVDVHEKLQDCLRISFPEIPDDQYPLLSDLVLETSSLITSRGHVLVSLTVPSTTVSFMFLP